MLIDILKFLISLAISGETCECIIGSIKDIVQILEAVVTVIAIAIGGYWSYMLFMKKRQKYPRANITHHILQKPISDGKVLLNVTAVIHNTGDVLLSILSGDMRIQQVLPLSPEIQQAIVENKDPVENGKIEIDWPVIIQRIKSWQEGEFEIEPGEEDQVLFDFIFEDKFETVMIYSYFKNVSKPGREIGWGLSSIFDLRARKEIQSN